MVRWWRSISRATRRPCPPGTPRRARWSPATTGGSPPGCPARSLLSARWIGGAAGEQARRGTHDQAQRQRLGRRRADHVLAQVEEVGDDQRAEEGDLRDEEAEHAPLARAQRLLGSDRGRDRERLPRRRASHGGRCDAHVVAPLVATSWKLPSRQSYCQSGSSGCFRSHSGRRLCTVGIVVKVVRRRRRGRGPLQRPGVPGVVAGRPAVPQRREHVVHEDQRSSAPG